MAKRRTWADPIDPIQAERHFSRFVHTVSRKRRSPGSARAPEATTMVTSPNRPSRRVDETTATFRHDGVSPNIEDVRKRRLLGQDELDATLTDRERGKLIVELQALYRHGHVDDAMAELEKVRCRYPNDLELHGSLADFFLERGDLSRAVAMLFHMIDSHFERADVEAARRCLARVKALDPDNERLRRFERLLAG